MTARCLVVVLLALAGCRQDRDGDGFVGRDDCDDRDAQVFPGAVERCNGADDDCDGELDEAADLQPLYVDDDGDGFGAGEAVRTCPPPQGHVGRDGDCDDGDASAFPGAAEACDGVDQDCDGQVDEAPDPPLYVDDDGDGFGDPARPVDCIAFAVADRTDCDDADDAVFPGADERCNGRDDDCDGATTGEEDVDADGAYACVDCDDQDAARSPLLPEVCNGVDDDCDGSVDGSEAWWSTASVGRVRVDTTVVEGSTSPLVVSLDARAALDALGQVAAFDPQRLRAAWQDCDASVELPVAWVEDEGWATGGSGPDAPEVGAVMVLFDADGDLDTVEPWPGSGQVGLYLAVDGEPAWSGGVAVGGTSLTTGGAALTLLEAAGGMAELEVGGAIRWSQVLATAGNGIRTGAGPLSAQDVAGSVVVGDGGAVTASMTTSVVLANPQGELDASWAYRRFAGRTEVWVRPRLTTQATTTLSGVEERTETVRPVQLWVPGSTVASHSPDLAYVLVDGPEPVAWSWLQPPAFLTHVGHAAEEAWASANDVAPCCDGPEGTVGAGVELVDGPILRVDVDRVDAAPEGTLRAPEAP